MVLSDKDIRRRVDNGSLEIKPYEQDNVEPASVDLRIGPEFKLAVPYESSPISLDEPKSGSISWDEKYEEIVLEPGDFVLGATKEYVELPDDLAAHVLGRSSLGRLGVSVHQTAGYIDPGFEGEITLELSNHGPAPVVIEADQRICQIVFEELSSSAAEPYGHSGSQYQQQTGATPSGMNFE